MGIKHQRVRIRLNSTKPNRIPNPPISTCLLYSKGGKTLLQNLVVVSSEEEKTSLKKVTCPFVDSWDVEKFQ